MSTKSVNVYFNNKFNKHLVGKLVYKDKTIYFEYDKSFLQKGIELSPYKLPLKSGVHICDDRVFDGLFGVFADSLPDGWGKLLIDRHLMSQGVNFYDITPLDRLMLIGHFGVGALSYEPIQESISAPNQQIILDTLAYSSQEILKGTSASMIDTLIAIGGSSAGARPKAMIQLNSNLDIIHGAQKLQEGYEHYMVKFPSITDHTQIGKLEYVYSQMAKDSGIDICDTKLLHGEKNSYFAIKRFDRINDERVHIHSVAGLVHSDFRIPSLDYDDLLTLTLNLTKDTNEQLKMFKLCVFNLLTHNRDDHAKNFSFILDDSYNWKLSPAYDLTFSFGPGGEHSTTYLGVGKNPSIKELEKLAYKHSIKNANQIIDEIKSIISNFKNYANNIDMSKDLSDEVFKNFLI
ncbi:MAG: type II toxin-antitoxin system HipA family toxin [Arcobacteraceae bacterium]|nr:type II toxin-antitoxin system HipA family toxin [Arcobacteraceae bacterium]